MNKLLAGLVVLTAAATLAAWLILSPGDSEPAPKPANAATTASPPPALEVPMQADEALSAPGESASDNAEPAAEATVGKITDAELLERFNCSATRQMVHLGDGLVTEAYACDPPDVEDPFSAHSDADLLVMSYSDADAAEALGKRLLLQEEEGPANEMMLRAVALRPDDISPLKYLVTQTGSLRGPSREARRQVGNAYIITKTASHFDPTITTSWLRSDLVEHRFTAEDIERLDRLVEGNLARMRAVQIEVFGESRIGEAL